MKNIVTTLLTILTLGASVSAVAEDATANEWTGNIVVLLGEKSLSNSDDVSGEFSGFNELNSHTNFGFMFDLGKTNWWTNIVIDYSGGSDSYSESFYDGLVTAEGEVSTSEWNIGARSYMDFGSSNFYGYVGAGLAFANAEGSAYIESPTEWVEVTVTERGAGVWGGVGVGYNFTDNWSVLLDVRSSAISNDAPDGDSMLGGTSWGLGVGFSF